MDEYDVDAFTSRIGNEISQAYEDGFADGYRRAVEEHPDKPPVAQMHVIDPIKNIYCCTNCGDYLYGADGFNFCPLCGAYLRERSSSNAETD